jgi:hypothetical protein
MRSGLCNCLAIYDWIGEISPVRFHEIAKAMFDANGVSPEVGSVSHGENALRKYPEVLSVLASSCTEVDLYHTISGYKQLVFGWDVFASLNTVKDKTMLLCFAQNLENLDLEYFEGVLRTLAEEIDLKYGVGYQRDFELGPDMYAHGMITGLRYSSKDMAEKDRISMWMHERSGANRHLHGYLRDVYPLNILSSCHLSRQVGNVSLARWIDQNPDRGYLSELSTSAWLWKVPQSCLGEVQAQLRYAGCTIVPPAQVAT